MRILFAVLEESTPLPPAYPYPLYYELEVVPDVDTVEDVRLRLAQERAADLDHDDPVELMEGLRIVGAFDEDFEAYFQYDERD